MGYLTPTEQAIAEQVSARLKDLEALFDRRQERAERALRYGHAAAAQEAINAVQAFREQYKTMIWRLELA